MSVQGKRLLLISDDNKSKNKKTTIIVMRMTENRNENTVKDKNSNHETKTIRTSKTRQHIKSFIFNQFFLIIIIIPALRRVILCPILFALAVRPTLCTYILA